MSSSKKLFYFSGHDLGRAFVIGCAIFVAEMMYFVSIESVFAADRTDSRAQESSEVRLRNDPSPTPIPVPPILSPIQGVGTVPAITPSPPPPQGNMVPTLPTSGVPSISPIPSIPDIPDGVGGSFDPAIPDIPNPNNGVTRAILALASETTTPTAFGNNLGANIKYCIVFPILNSVGQPIPTFDVPICAGGQTPPPGAPPRLTVKKVVINDNGGTATTTDFRLLVGSSTVQSGVMGIFQPGSHLVSEATTTVTIGTTTSKYTQSFSGDCSASGSVTLSLGDVKTCIITNNDIGPGSSGGSGGSGGPGGNGGGPGGNGGGPGGGGNNGGGSGSGGGSGPGGSSSGGGGGGNGPITGSLGGGSGAGSYPSHPAGQVLGTTTPDYMGGPWGIPGVPNAGEGGSADGVLGVLIFSSGSSAFGLLYLALLMRRRPLPRH